MDDAQTKYYAACAEAMDICALWRAFVDWAAAEGVARAFYHHVPPFGAPDAGQVRVLTTGLDPEIARRYVGEGHYLVDPVPAATISCGVPVDWRQIRRRRSLTDDEERALALIESWGDGLSVPVFGPGGRNGCFGVVPPQDPEAPAGPGLVWVARLQAACTIAHLRFCRLVAEGLPARPRLSRREQELMQWVAQGKSNGVIAEIMEISPHTVDAYLRRVFVKLGASDRISAVVRSLGAGLIRGY